VPVPTATATHPPATAAANLHALPLAGVPRGARAAFQFGWLYPGCFLLHATNALDLVVQ
jgi:hypothetical protein